MKKIDLSIIQYKDEVEVMPTNIKKIQTYADSGVDIIKEKNTIDKIIQELSFKRAGFGKPIINIGHYAGLIECGNIILAMTTDGVGSKVSIAIEMNKLDTVGIDCVAMNANDLISIGAEPLAFVDYLAVEKHDSITANQIGKGLNEGAKQACISVIGGETATLPDIINGFDLAGTCIGYIKNKQSIITGSKIKVGDILIGLKSTGVHSNGYSLIRKLIKEKNYKYQDLLPYDSKKTIGEELLTPTKIYIDVLKLIPNYDIHGLSHITGGGLLKLKRLTNYGFDISDPIEVPPVFKWIQKMGDIKIEEMYKTFNMGMGFLIVCSSKSENELKKILQLIDGKIIGKIIERKTIKIKDIIIE